ncbi:hypothetical protein CC79DRAFT_1391621 [Sarocladium strictum]
MGSLLRVRGIRPNLKDTSRRLGTKEAMQRIAALFVVLVLFVHAARAWVLVDRQTIDDAIAHPPAVVALIKDPKDAKTKNLEAEWDILENTESVPSFVYRCSEGDQVCDSVEASQFPKVLFYAEDDAYAYRGPRLAKDIDQFITRLQQDFGGELDPHGADAFMGSDVGACLLTASREKHQDYIKAFETVATKYRSEYSFGFIAADGEVTSPKVECRNNGNNKQKAYDQGSDGIEAFILEALRPVITDLTPYNHQRLLDRQWPMIYIFGDGPAQRAKLRKELHGFASSSPDLSTVLVDPLDFPDLPSKLGLKTPSRTLTFPAGAVHQLTTGKVWPYPAGKALDDKSLKQWGMDVWQGKVVPWNSKGNNGKGGQKTVKSNRKVKLPNVPGLEELRAKLEKRERREL